MKVKVQSLSCVQLSAILWTVALKAPLSMGFSRQEYWSGWPFPSPGDLPDSGIEPRSPSLLAQRLKHLPGMRETGVQSLGWEDPLEKAMAPLSSTLAWKIPWREEPGRLQSMGSQSRTRLSDFTFTFLSRSPSWQTDSLPQSQLVTMIMMCQSPQRKQKMEIPSHLSPT